MYGHLFYFICGIAYTGYLKYLLSNYHDIFLFSIDVFTYNSCFQMELDCHIQHDVIVNKRQSTAGQLQGHYHQESCLLLTL